jgi:hypothetical protein
MTHARLDDCFRMTGRERLLPNRRMYIRSHTLQVGMRWGHLAWQELRRPTWIHAGARCRHAAQARCRAPFALDCKDAKSLRSCRFPMLDPRQNVAIGYNSRFTPCPRTRTADFRLIMPFRRKRRSSRFTMLWLALLWTVCLGFLIGALISFVRARSLSFEPAGPPIGGVGAVTSVR